MFKYETSEGGKQVREDEARSVPAKDLKPGDLVRGERGTRLYPVVSVRRSQFNNRRLEVVVQSQGTWHFDPNEQVQVYTRTPWVFTEVRESPQPVDDPFYIIQGFYNDDDRVINGWGYDDEEITLREAKKLLREPWFEGDYVRIITRDGDLVWDSRGGERTSYGTWALPDGLEERRTTREANGGLHPAPYSKKNLQTDDGFTIQPSRGGWIVDYRGEFMGSVKKSKGGWKIDPIHGGGPVGGRHYDACKRATELLDAYFASGDVAREHTVLRDYEGMSFEQWLSLARQGHGAHIRDDQRARSAFTNGMDPEEFAEIVTGGFALEEGHTVREVNFQQGERLRIRSKGPQGQPFEAFWYTVDTQGMTLKDVALQFAQTAQPGMFIEIVNGKLKWTYQVGRHAGQVLVTPMRGVKKN